MRKNQINFLLIIFLILSINFPFIQAKNIKCEILNKKDIKAQFNDSLCKKLNLIYPIYKVYKYTDKSAINYIVLTESNDITTPNKDTLNFKISAYNFQFEKNDFIKIWDLNDFINEKNKEDIKTIWFWTKYCEFKDIDNDSLVDPIIIYGIGDNNYLDMVKIKILIYYKGEKYTISHQNGVSDALRNTRVDKEFYTLPNKIQKHVKTIMSKIEVDGTSIFPYTWQSAMKKKKTIF